MKGLLGVDYGIVLGSLLAAGAVGAVLLKFYKQTPPMKARRVELFQIALAIDLAFDVFRVSDGFVSLGMQFHSTSCGAWEFAASLYGVLLVTTLVFKASSTFLVFAKAFGAVSPASRKSSMLQSKSGKHMAIAIKYILQRHIRNMIYIASGLALLTLFVLRWLVVNEKFDSFDNTCFTSWAFLVSNAIQVVASACCLLLILPSFSKTDIHFLLAETAFLAISWLFYVVITTVINLIFGYGKTIESTIWMAYRVVYYYVIYIRYWVLFRRNSGETKIDLANSGSSGIMEGKELLQVILKDPLLSQHFAEFTNNEFCGEYLLFLREVDDFNTLLQQYLHLVGEERASMATDAEILVDDARTRAQYIAKNFLEKNSPFELNIDPGVKLSLCTKIANQDYDRSLLFADAVRETKMYLTDQVLLRFMKTDEGKALVREKLIRKESKPDLGTTIEFIAPPPEAAIALV